MAKRAFSQLGCALSSRAGFAKDLAGHRVRRVRFIFQGRQKDFPKVCFRERRLGLLFGFWCGGQIFELLLEFGDELTLIAFCAFNACYDVDRTASCFGSFFGNEEGAEACSPVSYTHLTLPTKRIV